LGRPVVGRARRGLIPLGCYAGCAQGSEPVLGWAGEEVSAHGQ
jgi:hypothetical protein